MEYSRPAINERQSFGMPQGTGGSPLRNRNQGNSLNRSGLLGNSSLMRSSYNEEEEEYNKRRQQAINNRPTTAAISQNTLQASIIQPQNRPNSAAVVSTVGRVSLKSSIPLGNNSHFTLGQQSQDLLRQHQSIPLHIKEHIAHLQNDNASLMRRLNLVHQELERINREKGDLQEQLNALVSHSSQAYDHLHQEENVDRSNKYMKDDLSYERDRNLQLRQGIQDLNQQVLNLSAEIRKMEEDQQFMIRSNQDSAYQIQRDLSEISDLEKEQYFNQERIRDTHLSIEQSQISNEHIYSQNQTLRAAIEMVIGERNHVLERVTTLTATYDEKVRQINAERKMMEMQNASHAKFITAKIIFTQLQKTYDSKMLSGFQEIQNYTKFDTKCNLKLRSLAKLMIKAGETKLRISINHWFSCALKPTQVKNLSLKLSTQTGHQVIENQFYRLWRDLYLKRVKDYESKTRGITSLWHKLVKDASIEKKRALRIWKETFSKFKLQKYTLKRLIWKRCFKIGCIAINAWKSHDSYFDSQVRLSLLAQQYSYQQQQAILFRNFHFQAQESKRRRHSRLSHCLQKWRNYLNRQKYVMSQNLMTSYFKTENFTSMIKACYDALKQHKQEKKYEKSREYLENDEMSRIQDLRAGNKYILDERYKVNGRRAFETIKSCLSKRVWSYLSHWRKINDQYHETVRTCLSDRLIKLYFAKIRIGFSLWRERHLVSKKDERNSLIQSIQGDNLDLQNQGIELTNSNNQKLDERSQQRLKHLLNCIESYELRFQSIATGRWRDRTQDINTKENGAYIIMRRLRLRLARKAFDLYQDGLKFKNKVQVQEARCAMFKKLRNQRLLNQVINQWMIYKQNHITAKNYWYRLYLRQELNYKQISIKKWRELTQNQVELTLDNHSKQLISANDYLNHTIGELDQTQTDQRIYINGQETLLNKQGQRILSNAFAHFYKTNLTRGFERWFDFSQFESRKLRLLHKAMQHSKKSQFYITKMAFQNFIKNADIKERQGQIKVELMRVNDTIFQTRMQFDNFERNRINLKQVTEEEKDEQSIFNIKLQNVIKLIIKRVNDNHYTSQRRFIFDQWSDYTRREVYFINCIKNVFSKSLWSTGFQAIQQHSRSIQKSNLKSVVLSNLFKLVTKRTLSRSFQRWRTGDFDKCKSIQSATVDTTADLNLKHHELKQKIKKHNRKRAEQIILATFQRNVIGAWRNIAKYLKAHREITNQCKLENRDKDINNALLKWRARSKLTRVIHASYTRTVLKINTLKLKMCFNALKHEHFFQRELCKRLGNLANVLDNLKLQTGYIAIKSFSKAKNFALMKKKENAMIWLGEALNGLFKNRMRQYVTNFNVRCWNKRKIDILKRLTISLNLNRSLRDNFLQWKQAASCQQLCKELNEEGPIREQHFGYKSELKNIKEMLKVEGYDEQDVALAFNKGSKKQNQLILKTISRLQHFNKEMYYVPKFFDRWREFIQYKKAFRYWLQFVEKRSQLIKSDLHYVFDRWKRFHPNKKTELSVKSKVQLSKQAVNNNRVLDRLADEIDQKEATIIHLGAQRETLLDNYVKAQKLGLDLWVNQHKFGMHQALLRWSDYSKTQRNFETKALLKNNLANLEILKQRISQLEAENDLVAGENEDLRQFSLDGYDIAKNVQALAGEREILSVDLADKAKVITKLLDENDGLTHKLSKTQDYAQKLITSIRAKQQTQQDKQLQLKPRERPVSAQMRPGSAASSQNQQQQQRPGSAMQGSSMNRTIRQ